MQLYFYINIDYEKIDVIFVRQRKDQLNKQIKQT